MEKVVSIALKVIAMSIKYLIFISASFYILVLFSIVLKFLKISKKDIFLLRIGCEKLVKYLIFIRYFIFLLSGLSVYGV